MNNNRNNRRARRAPRRRQKGQGRVTYQTSIPRGLAIHSGPSRFARLSDNFTVSLSNTDYFGGAPLSTELFQVLGMVEFLGYRPLYALELYAIYKYARVLSVDIEAQGVNTGANPVRMAVGHAAFNDVSGLTFDRFIEKPGTAVKTISPSTGMDRAVIRKSFNSSSMLGSVLDSKFWVDVSQSASTTPIDAKEPVLVMALDNYQSSGTAFSCQINWKLTYHIHWFDLKTPASS